MFTGIIEAMGTIRQVRRAAQGMRLTLHSDVPLLDTRIGDSIAVSGVCLTVVAIDAARFEADVSPESLSRSTLGRARVGERVNLERALRFSGRLDGHLVTGHVDGKGVLYSRRPSGNAMIVEIKIPRELSPYLVEKGSVAVDGISLTVNGCTEEAFEVSIIPHTAKLTTINLKEAGEPVNIETDIIAKYVEHFVSRNQGGKVSAKGSEGTLTLESLARSGFV